MTVKLKRTVTVVAALVIDTATRLLAMRLSHYPSHTHTHTNTIQHRTVFFQILILPIWAMNELIEHITNVD